MKKPVFFAPGDNCMSGADDHNRHSHFWHAVRSGGPMIINQPHYVVHTVNLSYSAKVSCDDTPSYLTMSTFCIDQPQG